MFNFVFEINVCDASLWIRVCNGNIYTNSGVVMIELEIVAVVILVIVLVVLGVIVTVP